MRDYLSSNAHRLAMVTRNCYMQINRVGAEPQLSQKSVRGGRRGPRDGGAGSQSVGRVWTATARPTERSGWTGQCEVQAAGCVTGANRVRPASGRPRGGACGSEGGPGSKACWVADGREGAWPGPVLAVYLRLRKGCGPSGRGRA